MPTPPVSRHAWLPLPRRLATAIAALALVLLMHLLLITWLQDELRLIGIDDEADEVVTLSLLGQAAEEATAPVPAAAPEPPAPPTSDTSDPVAAIPVSEAPPAAPAPAPAVAETPADSVAPEPGTSATARVDTAATAADAEPTPGNDAASASPPAAARALFERVSPPPPVVLSFSAVGVRNGRRIEGNGSMAWSQDGQRYRLNTEIGVLFFTLIQSRSEGELTALGIAPALYAEKRIGRAETNTHFHRGRQQISFSASTAIVPAQGGEQDRGTWIWQLASLGRGDPEKFESGLVFEMTVAGNKAADRWRIYVNGTETLELPDGPVSTWRLSVIPGPDSIERQFDLWLAPARDWYPVRLRHEDRNGNSVSLQLKKMTRPDAGAAPAAAGADKLAEDSP